MMDRWRQEPLDSLSPDAEPVPEELLEATAARLRPIRGTMPDAAFDALVHAVARFRLRWGGPLRTPDGG
jgi:hypothetical protein